MRRTYPDSGDRFMGSTGAIWLCLGYAYKLTNKERACTYVVAEEAPVAIRRHVKLRSTGVFGDRYVAMNWRPV